MKKLLSLWERVMAAVTFAEANEHLTARRMADGSIGSEISGYDEKSKYQEDVVPEVLFE